MERRCSADSVERQLDHVIEQDSMHVENKRPQSADPRASDVASSAQEKLSNGIIQSSEVNNNQGQHDNRSADYYDSDMRLDLGYTEDESPPDYDVTERVRQLNEELANDPVPLSDRERSIKFKENLIDFEAPPPPDYGESDNGEDEAEFPSQPKGPESTNEDAALPPTSPRSPLKETTEDKKEETEGEEVLVERGGKFEFVSSGDLSSKKEPFSGLTPLNGRESEVFPQPPEKPRPSTANIPRNRHSANSRAQSAGLPPIKNNAYISNYVSPYAMTQEEKESMAKQRKQKENIERKQKEIRSKMEEAKKEEANDAFQAWLWKKREDMRRKRDEEAKNQDEEKRSNDAEANDAFQAWLRKKREDMRRKRDEEAKNQDEEKRSNVSDLEEEDAEAAYSEWVKIKRRQKNKEKQIEQLKQREINEGWSTRPREQCNQAFKEWLKKKKQDQQNIEKEEKQKARVHRLLARRCRRSMALARAINVSQSFRYVDYYGYR